MYANIHLKDMWVKYKAKGSGGLLHVVAVKEPLFKGLKKMEYVLFVGFKRLQFQQQKKAIKKSQSPESSKMLMETESNTQVEVGSAIDASERAEVPKILSPGSIASCSD